MALALLLDAWARAKGGTITALTVDHGLRAEAGAEARQVGYWLRARGIAHRILRWRGPKPDSNIQARARRARYALLDDWCARQGILHLATAHNRDDQAETFLLRLARGSGLDGLAAMAPVIERARVRHIRPLLDVPRADLVATLRRAKQDWIEDPTNRDPAHARVRMRNRASDLAAEGLTAARLAGTARALGRARAALDERLAALLAESTSLGVDGVLVLDRRRLAEAPEETALRALGRVAQRVGGADFQPRLKSLVRLRRAVLGRGFRGVTLANCSWRPHGPDFIHVSPEATRGDTGAGRRGTHRKAGARGSSAGEPLMGASFAVV
jgi:tRNA(Ile)-lysidine synthase